MKFDVTAGILAERDRLAEEIERLREALAPFAAAADGRRRKDMGGAVCFCQPALLAARAALTPEPSHD